MNHFKNLVGLAFVIGLFLLVVSFLPLATAFQFGDDEGFEVIKPFLCYKGFKLYSEIWNDQPPILTVFLTTAFKVFGPTILTARLVAVGYGVLLLISFHELVRRRSGSWVALAAALLFLASPSVLLLSVSVMLEAAAIGTALASAWLLFIWKKRPRPAWLIGSGVLMGVALQTKMTAALVVPAVAVELLLLCRTDKLNSWLRNVSRNGAIWGIALLSMFLLIGATWGKGSLKTSWKSHTGEQSVSGFDRPEDHKFEPGLLRDHIECVAATPVAVILAYWRKRVRELAFPLVLLLTASVIHTVHRPWWNYYYVHFAVPVAWLSGWCITEIVTNIFKLRLKIQWKFSSTAAWRIVFLCAAAALPIAKSEARFEAIIKDLRGRQKASDNPIVRTLRESAGRTKWVYSESGIYPFHAKLLVPPELAIIMPKRFWSGQITTSEIVEVCEHYEPEAVILPFVGDKSDWEKFLKSGYAKISTDVACTCYLVNRLK